MPEWNSFAFSTKSTTFFCPLARLLAVPAPRALAWAAGMRKQDLTFFFSRKHVLDPERGGSPGNPCAVSRESEGSHQAQSPRDGHSASRAQDPSFPGDGSEPLKHQKLNPEVMLEARFPKR